MRRPLHVQAILVAAIIGVIAFLYFRGSETLLGTKVSSDNVFETNSASDTVDHIENASDESRLPTVASDHSVLTTDDIIEQMKQGNFSNVEFPESDRESMIKRLEMSYKDHEWVECDLNENGLKGLVLQEITGSYDGRIKDLDSIFALSNGKAIWIQSVNGGRITVFLSRNGNLVESYGIYGTTNINTYDRFIFDDELNIKYIYTLKIILIDDWYEEQVREYLEEVWDDEVERENLLSQWGSNAKSLNEFIESYPEETTAGEYYKLYDRTGEDEVEENLTKQQFLDAFEELTGLSFYEVNPEGMYMNAD